MIKRTLIIAITAAALAGIAAAHSFTMGTLKIGHPWAAVTTGQVGAAYLSIENSGDKPVRLKSARTLAADSVEIHEMSMTDGIMRMRDLPDGVRVDPGAKVALAPGGIHLMLKGLKQPLAEKDKVPLTLTFEDGTEIEVELHVQIPKPDEHKH